MGSGIVMGLLWIGLSVPSVNQQLGVQIEMFRPAMFPAIISGAAVLLLTVLYGFRIFGGKTADGR